MKAFFKLFFLPASINLSYLNISKDFLLLYKNVLFTPGWLVNLLHITRIYYYTLRISFLISQSNTPIGIYSHNKPELRIDNRLLFLKNEWPCVKNAALCYQSLHA